MERVGVYIDGFNLYFALKRKGKRHFYWLDPHALAQNSLAPGQVLTVCKYFTARITGPEEKRLRQDAYLQAIQTRAVQVFFGQYKDEEFTCRKCFAPARVPKEKMTDVNIAVQILRDAYADQWDKVALVSADSDLVPPLATVRELFPSKFRSLILPPGGFSQELKQVTQTLRTIGDTWLMKSLLPEEVTKADGFVLKRPAKWR